MHLLVAFLSTAVLLLRAVGICTATNDVGFGAFTIEVLSRTRPEESSDCLDEIMAVTTRHIFEFISNDILMRAGIFTHAKLVLTSFELESGHGLKGREFYSVVASFDGSAFFRDGTLSQERMYRIQNAALGAEGKVTLLGKMKSSADPFLRDAYKIYVDVSTFEGRDTDTLDGAGGKSYVGNSTIMIILIGVLAFIGLSLAVVVGIMLWKGRRKSTNNTFFDAKSSETKNLEGSRETTKDIIELSSTRSISPPRSSANDSNNMILSSHSETRRDTHDRKAACRIDRATRCDADTSLAMKIGAAEAAELSMIQSSFDSPNRTLVVPNNETLILTPERRMNHPPATTIASHPSLEGEQQQRQPHGSSSSLLREKLEQMDSMLQVEKQAARYNNGGGGGRNFCAREDKAGQGKRRTTGRHSNIAKSHLEEHDASHLDVINDLAELSNLFGRHRSLDR